MRDLFSKLMTSSMVAGAALLVAACGGSESANTADANMTDMNASESDLGTTNDVTAVDSANGAGAMDNSGGAMAGSTDNSAMGGGDNSAMSGAAGGDNATGNAQ